MTPKPKAMKPVKDWDDLKCGSCKKPLIQHLGLQGTCANLQIAIKTLKKIERTKCTCKTKYPCPGAIAMVGLDAILDSPGKLAKKARRKK